MSVHLGFPVHDLLFILLFPSFSFLSIFALFFSSSWHFTCFEALLFLELPSFSSHFLVSISCSFLYFQSLMVDYFVVRSDCPSVSFFFARLCSLLEVVGRRRPKVGLFVGRNCPFKFVLRFLFPLIHHFVGVAQMLAMFEEGEVRSSKLETGLSSSEDCGAFEVTSSSTPYKAWDICCALKGKDRGRIRNRFQFPSLVKVRIPDGNNRACHSYVDKVCFYEVDFVSNLRFPIHPFLRELFSHLLLALA